jgi:hypothetical protein
MTYMTYEIVQHDGGWAYKLGDTVSGTYQSRSDALEGAKSAVARQQMAEDDIGVLERSFDDDDNTLLHS